MFARDDTALPWPDFAARPRTQRRLGVLLTAAAALWLGGTLADALRLHERGTAARAEAARWEARQAKLLDERSRNALPTLPDELRRKAWRISEGLRFGWGGVLAALESRSAGGLQWLALDIDRERGSFRLEGIAADAAGALKASDAIAALPGFGDVVMARLAALDGAPGQRFEVAGRIVAAGVAATAAAP